MRLCATCAGQGKSCCLNRDILVSNGDLQRITAHTGSADFFEKRAPQTAAYLDQDNDPNWNPYTLQADGTRRVLKYSRPGICWFLTASGCQLPEQVRPLVCRLHPVEYTEEKITGVAKECPAEQLPAGASLLTNLEMNLDLAENWRQQLYGELGEEHRRRAGQPDGPSRPQIRSRRSSPASAR